MQKTIASILIVSSLFLAACPNGIPPQIPQDMQDAEVCVANVFLSGGSWPQVLTSCSQYALAALMAALQSLLASKQWTTAHPDLVPKAQAALADAKAKAASTPSMGAQ
jgi:hypothetical protein